MTNKRPTQSIYVPPPLRGCRSNHLTPPAHGQSPTPLKTLKTGNPRNISNDIGDISALVGDLSLSSGSDCHRNAHIANAVSTPSSVSDPSPTLPKERKNSEQDIDFSKFKHILELSTPSTELNSSELQAELAGFEDSGFFLKWVDDHHCLAVFSSVTEAHRAFAQISGLCFKARRMEDASPESKAKLAKSPGDWSMPYKRRPPTTSFIAKRLITGHLGLKPNHPRPQEDIEQEIREKLAIAEARAQNERRKKVQKSLWDED